MPDLMHLRGRVLGRPLMTTELHSQIALEVLAERIGLSGYQASPDAKALYGSTERPERALEVRDGIAIVPVYGSLVQRSMGMDAMSGLRSYSDIANELNEAANRSDVSGVLLDIDSPGGEVSGIFDLADTVAAVAKRMPVYAVANSQAFSAAYAIASQATKIFVPRTGGVGSIGVIAHHVDQSAAHEKAGLAVTVVKAGDQKDALSPHKPLDDEARNDLQAEVDRIHGMFVKAVAKGRGMSEQAVRDTQARLFFGGTGVRNGLADKVGTFEDALEALTKQAGQPGASQTTARGSNMSERITASQDAPELEAEVEAADAEGAEVTEEQAAESAEGEAVETTEDSAAEEVNETDDQPAETGDVLAAAEAAGASMSVVRDVLEKGMTLEQAKARFDVAGQVRAICAQAESYSGGAVKAADLEAKVFAGDASPAGARKAVIAALAEASESVDIAAEVDPETAHQEPPKKQAPKVRTAADVQAENRAARRR